MIPDNNAALIELRRRASRLEGIAAEVIDWPSKEAANRLLTECKAFGRGLPQRFGNVTSQITYLMDVARMITKPGNPISDARSAAHIAFARIEIAIGIHERAAEVSKE